MAIAKQSARVGLHCGAVSVYTAQHSHGDTLSTIVCVGRDMIELHSAQLQWVREGEREGGTLGCTVLRSLIPSLALREIYWLFQSY